MFSPKRRKKNNRNIRLDPWKDFWLPRRLRLQDWNLLRHLRIRIIRSVEHSHASKTICLHRFWCTCSLVYILSCPFPSKMQSSSRHYSVQISLTSLSLSLALISLRRCYTAAAADDCFEPSRPVAAKTTSQDDQPPLRTVLPRPPPPVSLYFL